MDGRGGMGQTVGPHVLGGAWVARSVAALFRVPTTLPTSIHEPPSKSKDSSLWGNDMCGDSVLVVTHDLSEAFQS